MAPFMQLTPPNGSVNWDAALLTRIPLIFPGQPPEEQRAKAFSTSTVTGQPGSWLFSGRGFRTRPPARSLKFLVDGAVGEWREMLGDTSANPELSWEYWNSKGWWKLHVSADNTQNMKTTGRCNSGAFRHRFVGLGRERRISGFARGWWAGTTAEKRLPSPDEGCRRRHRADH